MNIIKKIMMMIIIIIIVIIIPIIKKDILIIIIIITINMEAHIIQMHIKRIMLKEMKIISILL
jgi:hypothetical protein